ncbi:uncharacterized protein PITG_16764 [Phytophthora infestans T30-4]|uniref:Uncharacterized protein n=1 Tax=Phytophthora infestans (strain T30-4) TaxID=403677 RepID=D0NUU9_PHYIT|nr:uncharacterized protein PITG_16764 [Phytophthora infestans T30-4]EEY65472.1 hypothetical protein PITG_16764 [Phytophthora infestans T30-4]|eukprot:XP_002897101.1 hypothetical protein PITG_16764 [Phytophthora infestans T30-4]
MKAPKDPGKGRPPDMAARVQESKRDKADMGDEEVCYKDDDDKADEPGAQREETQSRSKEKKHDNGESLKEEARNQSDIQADSRRETLDVAPKEMFDAIAEEMKKADSDQPRTAWIMTIWKHVYSQRGSMKTGSVTH